MTLRPARVAQAATLTLFLACAVLGDAKGEPSAEAPAPGRRVVFAPAWPTIPDLDPYLTGRDAALATYAFEAGEHDEAYALYLALEAAATTEEEAAAARVLAAVNAHYAGLPDAYARLRAEAAAWPDLAAFLNAIAAENAYRDRDWERALDAATRVPQLAGTAGKAAQIAARAEMRLGRHDAARARLEASIDLHGESESTLLLLARSLRRIEGQEARVESLGRRILALAPESWEAGVVTDWSDGAVDDDEDTADAVAADRGHRDLVKARDAASRRRNKRALRYARRALEHLESAGERCAAAALVAAILERDRSYADAVAAWTRAIDVCAEPGVADGKRVRVYLGAADAAFQHGELAVARGWLDGMTELAPTPEPAARGASLRGEVELAAGEREAARAAFTSALAVDPDPRRAREHCFELAWLAIGDADWQSALRYLAHGEWLLPEADRHWSRGRSQYWSAQGWRALGEVELAAAQERALVAGHPLGWYAGLTLGNVAASDGPDAALALWEHAVLVGTAARPLGSTLPEDATETPAWRAAVALARLGLAVSVERELSALVPGIDTEDEAWLEVAFLARMGAWDEAVATARREVPGFQMRTPRGAAAWQWRSAFPLAFSEAFGAAADATGVPPELLLAIAREESSFDPSARSRAGAEGLMQVMPTTRRRMLARDVATLGLRDDPRAAWTPAVSALVGARYLGEQVDRFAGEPALVAAAYNAGGRRVERWIEASDGARLDAFVEGIPFRETRRYSKRVAASVATYQWVRWGMPGWFDPSATQR